MVIRSHEEWLQARKGRSLGLCRVPSTAAKKAKVNLALAAYIAHTQQRKGSVTSVLQLLHHKVSG